MNRLLVANELLREKSQEKIWELNDVHSTISYLNENKCKHEKTKSI